MRLFGLGRRVLTILLCLVSLSIARADERAAAKIYEELRTSNGLEAFLRAFPKGGDLHNHMAGGIYPEKWIEIAIKRNFCVDEQLLILVENLTSTCPAGMVPAATLRKGGPVYNRFVDAMSVRGKEKAHDYFFQQVFGHVRASPELMFGDVLEAVVVHAHEQNLTYLELQIFPFGWADSGNLAASLPAEGSMTDWLDALEKSPLLQDLVEHIRRTIQQIESELLERRPAEAAAIRRRYIITVGRGISPQHVFSQLAAFAELARVEPRVVGMSLAGAEDNAVSLRDFRLQMRMIDFILSRKPWVRVTLHAGEMTPQILGAAPGVVPEALTFHIAESVWNGHAERIGHGTALLYEKDRAKLLRAMRERGVLVEICLTSEELIQNLKSDEIPFVGYRQAGVPVSLNTDDEGVLGSDLSHEFLRAARDYHLEYGDLKELARNSIEYSFLPGHSLFRTREFKVWVPACPAAVGGEDLAWSAYRDRLGADCRAYLDNNAKAEAQARLEHQFQQFESSTSLRRFQPRGNAKERQ
jgi:adenosine deaminase/adenosine deaminase CECR1